MPTANTDQPWSIIVLTCRPPETDFRLPLARELATLGHKVDYIYVRRHPVVTTLSPIAKPPAKVTLLQMAALMRRRFQAGTRNLVINSTNLAFPGTSRSLRFWAGGLWCLDLHDDLLYEYEGASRVRARVAQQVLLGGADLTVHAASTLSELFPRSYHLGNASDLVPLKREGFRTDRVLVLASLDGRFDFDFFSAVAKCCPETTFDVYGQISRGSATTLDRLNGLIAAHPNVVYHGAYNNEALTTILSKYSVTFAPYATNSRLTYFIDPLRFYHCLNSGMEIVSTDIPSARELSRHITVIGRPEDFPLTLSRLGSKAQFRKNSASAGPVFTWQSKAVDLLDIVGRHLRDRA